MLPEAYVHIYMRTCYLLYRRESPVLKSGSDVNYEVAPETTYENVIVEHR